MEANQAFCSTKPSSDVLRPACATPEWIVARIPATNREYARADATNFTELFDRRRPRDALKRCEQAAVRCDTVPDGLARAFYARDSQLAFAR